MIAKQISILPQGWTSTAPDSDAFFAMAQAALAALPAAFHPHIADLLICIEDMADSATLQALEISDGYELTGLYEGIPLTEQSVDHSATTPDRIILFRRPILLEWIEGGERLDWLIQHVLIHEIGHHFGFSDDDMHRLEASADSETSSDIKGNLAPELQKAREQRD